jgi:hypothetical protein
MDELTAPLGQSRPQRRPVSVPHRLALVLGVVCLIGAALGTVLIKHPVGDKPAVAVPPLQVQADPPIVRPRIEPDVTGVVHDPADVAGRRTVTIIDGMSGRRQEVVVGSPQPDAGAVAGQRSRSR